MTPWKKYKLKDVIEQFIDYRGKTPKKVSSGVPLITAKIIKNGRINEPNEFIANESYHEWMRRGFPEVGDIILTTEAPLGEVAQLNTKQKVALAQRIITLRGKKNLLDNTYLKYSLLDKKMQSRLHARASGSTVSGIKSSELRIVEIDLPPLPEQRRIAEILSSLDDKIELNLEMNKTLEQMAMLLYKRWFVDFEFPDSEGKPYKSNGGEFVESELGLIPKGWEVKTIYDCADFINGLAFKSKDFSQTKSGIPIIKIVELKAGISDQTQYTEKIYAEKYKLNNGDIIFSWSGNPDTSLDVFIWDKGSAWLNQHIFRVITYNSLYKYWIFLMLKYHLNTFINIAHHYCPVIS
jgi:type I restriction enzyme, S subunit